MRVSMWILTPLPSLVFDWSHFFSLFNRKGIILISKMVLKMGWTLMTSAFEIHPQESDPDVIDIAGKQSCASHSSLMKHCKLCNKWLYYLTWIWRECSMIYSRAGRSTLEISLKMSIRWCIMRKFEPMRTRNDCPRPRRCIRLLRSPFKNFTLSWCWIADGIAVGQSPRLHRPICGCQEKCKSEWTAAWTYTHQPCKIGMKAQEATGWRC